MNALVELLGKQIDVIHYSEIPYTEDESPKGIDLEKYKSQYLGHIITIKKKIDHYSIIATPTYGTVSCALWLQFVDYAYIECPADKILYKLNSKRNSKDEEEFIKILSNIDYDNGYGRQVLFGTIVFKDKTWLSRREYDGSEWWEYNQCPSEDAIDEHIKEELSTC